VVTHLVFNTHTPIVTHAVLILSYVSFDACIMRALPVSVCRDATATYVLGRGAEQAWYVAFATIDLGVDVASLTLV